MNEELKSLIEQVRSLFTKYGIKSMTMDDIARELGMSKKTLYQHVKNKDELVEYVLNDIMNEYNEHFDTILSKKFNAIEFLIQVNKLVHHMIKNKNLSFEFDLKKYHPEIFRSMRKQNTDKMFAMVLKNIKQGKKEELYRKNLNAELIAKHYVDRIVAVKESELITEEEKMQPEFVNQIIEYHIRGIANEKGIKLYEQSSKNMNQQKEV